MLSSLVLFKRKKKSDFMVLRSIHSRGQEITEIKNISRKSIDKTRPLQMTQRWALRACWQISLGTTQHSLLSAGGSMVTQLQHLHHLTLTPPGPSLLDLGECCGYPCQRRSQVGPSSSSMYWPRWPLPRASTKFQHTPNIRSSYTFSTRLLFPPSSPSH